MLEHGRGGDPETHLDPWIGSKLSHQPQPTSSLSPLTLLQPEILLTALQVRWRFRGSPASGSELVTSLSSTIYDVNNGSSATTGYRKLILKCVLLLVPLAAAAERLPRRFLLAVVSVMCFSYEPRLFILLHGCALPLLFLFRAASFALAFLSLTSPESVSASTLTV